VRKPLPQPPPLGFSAAVVESPARMNAGDLLEESEISVADEAMA
jgi:hypothetical protein